jgi:hypothetical protein
MQMGVMLQILAPGMEYGEEADLGSQVCGVSSNCTKGLRRGTK